MSSMLRTYSTEVPNIPHLRFYANLIFDFMPPRFNLRVQRLLRLETWTLPTLEATLHFYLEPGHLDIEKS